MRNTTLLMTGAVLGIGGTLMFTQLPFLASNASAANTDVYQKLSTFGEIFERVRADYVESPDEEKMIEAAINGMLASLDPHSRFLNLEEFKDMQTRTRGEFGGLGIEVTMENGYVKVVAPFDDTPAARAGIVANDLITHIDGEQVQGLSLEEAVKRMRGAVGSPIKLRVARENVKDPLELEITRELIRIQIVRHRIEDNVGYVRITSFSDTTYEMMEKAIRDIQSKVPEADLKGYVLDLRNNPGGLLDQAKIVSDGFLESGMIVSTRGRVENTASRDNATAGDLTKGKPVIVLINGGSASASEIVAGALQDNARAVVLGTRSFGKASVQTVFPLSGNVALKLTTARYYTPSGRSIQAKGISPDIKIEQVIPDELKDLFATSTSESSLRGHLSNEDDDEATGSSAYVPAKAEDDTQLQYALQLLRGEVQNDAFPPQKEERAELKK